jgi:negative regulator of flagellin synthesis FlgM
MRINNFHFEKIRQSYMNTENNADKKRQLRSDATDISSKAIEIQNLEEKLKEIPDIRRERVEEIKNRLLRGEYKVDSYSIIKKILSEID